MIWLSDTKCCHLAIHYVLPKILPGPNLHFRFMKNCIHTSPLGSLASGQVWNEISLWIGEGHGLRTPNGAFFHLNPEFLNLDRQIGQINSGAFEVFSDKLSKPILVQRVPCRCFPLFNNYFYNKLSLYIHIPNPRFSLRLSVVRGEGPVDDIMCRSIGYEKVCGKEGFLN